MQKEELGGGGGGDFFIALTCSGTHNIDKVRSVTNSDRQDLISFTTCVGEEKTNCDGHFCYGFIIA